MPRIVDLSFPIHEGMTTFPSHWHPMVEITQMGRHGIENRETRKLVLGTHTGTHVDAPSHFIPGGTTIDRIPLDKLCGPAAPVDLTFSKPKHAVTLAEIKKAVGARRHKILLLRYDWSKKWGDRSYYTDYPFLSTEAAAWIVSRGTTLLGMDAPSPDNPAHNINCKTDSPVHKILLGKGVVLSEYLANLKALGAAKEVTFFAMPLKVLGADGAPARCVAIVGGRG
jgi:arylformamidase